VVIVLKEICLCSLWSDVTAMQGNNSADLTINANSAGVFPFCAGHVYSACSDHSEHSTESHSSHPVAVAVGKRHPMRQVPGRHWEAAYSSAHASLL
jgi:hypothetical protein